MKVICPKCSQVRDVTGMAPDSVVECECGQAFRVPQMAQPAPPPPIGPGGSMSSNIPPYSPAETQPPYQPSYGAPSMSGALPTPGHAVASIILGILSFMCCGIFMSIPGLILGYKARSMIDDNPGAYGGRGAATAGIVINWISLVLFVLVMIFAVAGGLLDTLGSL